MILKLLAALLLASQPAQAQALEYNYVVLKELEADEEWWVSGNDGEYVCSAVAFCLGIRSGTMFSAPRSLLITPLLVKYTTAGLPMACTMWECKVPNG
tara:strand:- start:178 stop:471 length:294 start_codon:yes stop_codon:yes gene_type:complete